MYGYFKPPRMIPPSGPTPPPPSHSRSMQSNGALRTFITAQRHTDPDLRSLTLEDLLMMPIQRMPRYELLLHSMLKSTPPSHPDHALLASAHKGIQGLCCAFNASKSDAEKRHREQRCVCVPACAA